MKHTQENNEFKAGIEEIKQISLTTAEKTNMLEHILKGSTFVECPIESPYMRFSFISMFSQKSFVYVGAAFSLFIMLSGGAVFASTGSLPGSVFYPLKVKVVEPAQGALIVSKEDKITYQNKLIEKRFIEAETLARAHTLDEDKENEISSLIEDHTQAFTEAVVALRAENSIDADTKDDIVINFEAQMNAHAEVLDALYDQQDTAKIDQSAKISQTARDNGVKVRNELKNKPEDSEIESKKTKEDVQLLIDKTNLDITAAASMGESAEKDHIITNTNKNLEHARALLKEVDDEDEKGNSENAHEKLLDSESAAKTASILLNLGFSVNNK